MGGFDAAKLVEELQEGYATGKTKTLTWRLEQLNGFIRLLSERREEIYAALKEDMNKPEFEICVGEIQLVQEEAKVAIKNLKKWMKPEKVSSTMASFPSSAEIIPEPFGVVLIISAWNFPINLALNPMVGAIGAGNAVVLKPSELAPASAALLSKVIPLYFDQSVIRVVEGGIEEATALLDQKWDKILYTGGTRVGRIVMTAAAKHLTPVTLELGGKCPVIVDSTADMDLAAKRIAWGKWANNYGQACLAPDYVLAEESIVTQLVSKTKDHLKSFFGDDPSTTTNAARVVNLHHFKRVVALLDEDKTKEKIVHGGQHNESTLYIEPAIILDPPLDSLIMREEIFGPLLPIITVKNVDEAIKFVNSLSKPLSLYMFSTKDDVVQHVLSETSSGGVTINDTIFHCTIPSLPFGGVGDSGMGGYHGKHSFDTFSHKKAVLYRSFKADIPFRYPPYTEKKMKVIQAILAGDLFLLIRSILGM